VSDQDDALARRWMASKHWGGWRRGMKVSGRGLLLTGNNDRGHVWCDGLGKAAEGKRRAFTPDLDHPGTRAFLLEDVRRAWGRRDIVCGPHHANISMVWKIFGRNLDRGLWGEFETEAEALIAALEAAPE